VTTVSNRLGRRGGVKEILVIRPQMRDLWSIDHADLGDRFRVRYAGPGLDPSQPFDVTGYLDRVARIPADGIVATHEDAALLAALVAQQRRLPGPKPDVVFACQYKPASRACQEAAAPDAVPRYAILDPAVVFEPPFFVKPVFGTLSGGARRIDDLRQLTLLDGNGHARRYATIAEMMGLAPTDACGYLVEELLRGDEATLEGYVLRGRLITIGITDSVKYAGTNSFERFEYPTRLSEDRQAELIDIAERIVAGLDFDDGMLNIEFFVPEHGPTKIIEVNPRIAAQYAPLIKALHGRSTYEILFELACGEDPHWHPQRPEGAAISYCLRTFRDAFVERVPEPQHGLEILVEPGLRLSEQNLGRGGNDPHSYRLAIFYETGETKEEALLRCRERASSLDFGLIPCRQ
jgi:hypothetical protein